MTAKKSQQTAEEIASSGVQEFVDRSYRYRGASAVGVRRRK